MNKEQLNSLREQIQEDILCWLDEIDPDFCNLTNVERNALCQIVVDNFSKLDLNNSSDIIICDE